jgi:Delta7-sterol 5-desaturase
MTNVVFLFEVRGYSQLYDNVNDSKLGWLAIIIYGALFIFFTDMCIYWIHRILHHKLFYKRIHKLHHKWIVPTPFASHAFHPIDGFMQSIPYHIYVFLFPLHKIQYLFMFLFVNVWTVSIHDADYRVIDSLKEFINGSAHHTDHHLYFNCNYGQFFTLWDRIGGSFKKPDAFKGEDIKKSVNKVE